MRLPLSLIRSFLPLDLPPAQIANALTLLGIEVDLIENERPPFSGVVVGEVRSTRPHPNAEKLQIVEVKEGNTTLQIVCGASNCRQGLKTALAKIGARLTDQDGKQREITKNLIRGVESSGMLCSNAELGLSGQEEGIIELPQEWESGEDLIPLLWDPIFHISLTPNLGHCMSALGIARELSAALQIPFHKHEIPLHKPRSSAAATIRIDVPNPTLCPLYLCCLIENVTIKPSPFWLQRQLLACGINPICNAVDSANYILCTMGQPLHIFDADKIKGRFLQTAPSQLLQKFIGLDEIEREIPTGTLLISDAQRPIAIAGILGGANSAVSAQTRNLLIESALFDPALIRKTTRKLALRTESAQRFEKGIDPQGVRSGLMEACDLILKVCGGFQATDILEKNSLSKQPKEIHCRPHRINHLLGTTLSHTEIQEILHRLGCLTTKTDKDALRVTPPSFRLDLTEEIDLVEEVARIYGYNRIAKTPSRAISSKIPHDPAYLFEKEVRTRLIALGLQEFLSSDLISPALLQMGKEWLQKDALPLQTLHAKTEEYSLLRLSLLPGLMQAALKNFGHKTHSLHAFEIGRVHFLHNEQVVEEPMAAILLSGKNSPLHWSVKSADCDLFDLIGLVENFLEGLRICATFSPSQHCSFHPGRQADILSHGLIIGSVGEIHPELLEQADIKQRLLYAEVHLPHLMTLRPHRVRMHPIALFPSSERDWTLPLALNIPMSRVFEAIQAARTPLLARVELIDLYQPEGCLEKNATFRFTYRDPLRTLSFEEVETQHQILIEKVILAK